MIHHLDLGPEEDILGVLRSLDRGSVVKVPRLKPLTRQIERPRKRPQPCIRTSVVAEKAVWVRHWAKPMA